MGRIFSGIQPTGNFHLGNYLGAIRNWVRMQDSYENFICIVDLHAMTTRPTPQTLQTHIKEAAATLLASGIDPEKTDLFIQSAVPAHCELAWILSCLTSLGWLNRMTQFKEKAGKQREQANLGLYSYPVLQAADILIYKATHVPVGEDQKQHLELVRDIAGTFNRQYEVDYFEFPEPIILKTAARIMSLRDGSSKMSKSDPSDYSRIHLMDDPETITLKIRKAKTDPEPIAGNPKAMENRPEALNLLGIYAALSDQSLEEVCLAFEGSTFAPFKEKLTAQIIMVIEPIRQRMISFLKDPEILENILKKGSEKARDLASQNLSEIQNIIGFLKT
ncbi:MAG: tryptophan--tRNA ligase [Proteobacteria bacterium]|nr:tryptophan--tRNA ligase [Pseudomonadota bacterium]